MERTDAWVETAGISGTLQLRHGPSETSDVPSLLGGEDRVSDTSLYSSRAKSAVCSRPIHHAPLTPVWEAGGFGARLMLLPHRSLALRPRQAARGCFPAESPLSVNARQATCLLRPPLELLADVAWGLDGLGFHRPVVARLVGLVSLLVCRPHHRNDSHQPRRTLQSEPRDLRLGRPQERVDEMRTLWTVALFRTLLASATPALP